MTICRGICDTEGGPHLHLDIGVAAVNPSQETHTMGRYLAIVEAVLAANADYAKDPIEVTYSDHDDTGVDIEFHVLSTDRWFRVLIEDTGGDR